MIKDSGERRIFHTGAVRDISEGKGRCDLLPLDVISKWTNDNTFLYFDSYIRNGNISNLYKILDYNIAPAARAEILISLSKHYEAGAKKYEERNWEKGILLHCYIDSAIRHFLKHKQGLDDEEHFIAFIWNVMCAIWTHENRPEMIDLPFAETNSKCREVIDHAGSYDRAE